MIKNIPMWKVAKRGNDVKAVIMYKDKNGRKSVALGTDKSKEGKEMLANMLAAEYTMGRAYAEISDNALAFILKHVGKDTFIKILIPVDKVKEIMKDNEIIPINTYLYKREIGGTYHKKIMIGNPGVKIF